MDFSTPRRALESLPRRRPALDDDIVELAKKMIRKDTDYVQGCLTFLCSDQSDTLVASTSSSSSQTTTEATTTTTTVTTTNPRWESLAVGIYLSTDLLLHHANKSTEIIYVEGPRVPSMTEEGKGDDDDDDNDDNTEKGDVTNDHRVDKFASHDQVMTLSKVLLQTAKTHLEHKEPRVRTLVAKAVGAVIALQEASLEEPTKQLHGDILKSLYQHLNEGRDNPEKYSKSSTGALDDTTGWRALETNWQGLTAYVAASGPAYMDKHPLTPQLLEACEYSCIDHVNRHVRAAGIAILEQWVKCCEATDTNHHFLLDPQSSLRQSIVKVLKVTLADNWSQVRMAASVLCRVFWQALLQHPLPDRHVETLYPTLIPRMCLNRFYLAQGVKLYSHDTWMILFADGGGLEAVASCVGAVCRYYVKMCDADNHVVREAACQAVAELAHKIGGHAEYAPNLQPFVTMLLQALLMCFHDESWPVRDEACLACGRFCRAYPQECLSELPLLKERWIEQLTDQIWSVREDAAVALGDAIVAYPEMQQEILAYIQKTMPSAREQPAMTKEELKKHENDIEAHSEQQLYSCGSLAPKLRKGGAGRIGCSNCSVTRPKSPWEATDGSIYLMRELIHVSVEHDTLALTDEVLLPLMQEMADVCRVKHFPQSDDMRATLFRQLPMMAQSLGKQRFKRTYLQVFIDVIMNALESRTESALSRHAAGQCAEELAQLVGPSIFRGRLDDFQQAVYDRVMRERAMMPKGPGGGGATGPEPFMSPFGPPGMIPGAAGIHPGITGTGVM